MCSFPPVQEVTNLFPHTLQFSVLKAVLKTVHYSVRSKSTNSVYVNQPRGSQDSWSQDRVQVDLRYIQIMTKFLQGVRQTSCISEVLAYCKLPEKNQCNYPVKSQQQPKPYFSLPLYKINLLKRLVSGFTGQFSSEQLSRSYISVVILQ